MGKRGPKPKSKLDAWHWMLDRIIKEGDCWLLKAGATVGIGYKYVSAEGTSFYAHRITYELQVGELTEGLVIRHTCDRPNCINPAHLVQGTHADNVADKVAKRRHTYGENHPSSVLTWEQVRAIRAEPPTRLQTLADKYGISRGGILQIIRNQTWKV